MALFSSTSISMGLYFTDTHVSAVRLHEERGIIINKKELPNEVIVNGKIQKLSDCSDAVHSILNIKNESEVEESNAANFNAINKSWWKRLKRKDKKNNDEIGIALCLPPEAVYTTIFSIPLIVGKNIEEEVFNWVRKTIPEEPDDILLHWKQIGKTADKYHVSVVAINKDVLQSYKRICAKHKLRAEVITIPASVILLSAAENTKDTILLYSRLADSFVASTLLFRSIPVDEAIFNKNTTLEEQTEKSLEILEDQRKMFGILPKKVVFIGSDEEFEQLKKQQKFSVLIERTTFEVPTRLIGYEIGLFSILSARKNHLVNLLEAKQLPKE